jgi:hypothetical protein
MTLFVPAEERFVYVDYVLLPGDMARPFYVGHGDRKDVLSRDQGQRHTKMTADAVAYGGTWYRVVVDVVDAQHEEPVSADLIRRLDTGAPNGANEEA